MRKRMRDRRNSSSMLSLCAGEYSSAAVHADAYLELLSRVRAISQVDEDLAHLGLEQQGVGDASQRFLSDVDVGFLEGIATQYM
jgi:hypothetical protein